MKRIKLFLKKKTALIILLPAFLVGVGVFIERPDIKGLSTADNQEIQDDKERDETEEALNKGYNLPIDDKEKKEAVSDCKMIMAAISDIYAQADKGNTGNPVISDAGLQRMQDMVSQMGYPVTTKGIYTEMGNYKEIEDFLEASSDGEPGEAILYQILTDGGIGRNKYIFDGTDMYVLETKASWYKNNIPSVAYEAYNRINEWSYTDKGWFCYELCVPEPPAVTELVDGSCMLRIKPMDKRNREYSEKYLYPLGYQGNNLLCSDWDEDNLEYLDYNGMFEYLYGLKYHKTFDGEDYQKGIGEEEFENVLMDFIPVTPEQIKNHAVYDEKNQTYAWSGLGCLNFAPTTFGTSVPEVTQVRENQDGTVTLTVDAVCERMIHDEAVITHELTMQLFDDGSFRYLGNKVLNNGLENIPDYQYRIRK